MIWHCSTCELIRKIQKVQQRYGSDYDVLLRKSGKETIKIKRLRVLAIEIFKTVNNLNPNYMKDILTPKLHTKVRPNDILLKHHYIQFQKPKYFRSKDIEPFARRH